jgi:hypothetical protein
MRPMLAKRSNRRDGFRRLRTGTNAPSSAIHVLGFRRSVAHYQGRGIAGRMHYKHDLASNPRGQRQARVRQGQPHPERAARRVVHAVDNRNGGHMDTTDRLLWSHFGAAADPDLPKIGRRHEDLDPQRVDLREREDRALIVSILAWYEEALDHHAVDWASQRPLFQNLLRMRDFQARNLPGELRLPELLFGNLNLRFGFLERSKRADGFGMELCQSLVFETEELHASFSRLHR